MNTNLSFSAPSQVETDCLVAVVLDRSENDRSKDARSKKDRGKNDKPVAAVESGDAAVRDAAKDVIAGGEVTGKMFETTLVHRPAGLKAKSIRSFAFALPEKAIAAGDAVRSVVEGAFVGNFEPDYYKSDRKDLSIEALTIVAQGDKAALEEAMRKARVVAESQNFTRDLVNEPSNRMTPAILGERARKMAAEVGLKCEVHGADKLKELKMGAFWGVAQGSDEPPALIVLRYEPEGAAKDVHLGLVGKGITFDTGGISIKPSDGMEKMKYDMAGGATMIGVMRAIALLKPKVKVTAIICATENMPSGKAQKPGDVQIGRASCRERVWIPV